MGRGWLKWASGPSTDADAAPGVVAKDLLRDLLRIVAGNEDFSPTGALRKMRLSRDWRTIGTLSGLSVRTHNPLVVCSNHTGPIFLCWLSVLTKENAVHSPSANAERPWGD